MQDDNRKPALAAADVDRLLADPSPAVRADTASKIAREFAGGSLSARERGVAEDIFRVLLRDVEVRVRETLARTVKQCPTLPHDVAVALARDVDRVALPILAFSEALTDDDLVAIVREAGAEKQAAIAGRPSVSEPVSQALIARGNEEALDLLLRNHGAAISEAALTRLLDQFGDRERLHEPLAGRPALPIGIAERLVTFVSERLQDHILRHHPLRPALVSDLIVASRERATVALLGGGPPDESVLALARQLHAGGRLTPAIILRAICLGDIRFCEASFAVLADLPLINAQTLIHDAGQLGLKGIYDKADLPAALFSAFRVAIDVVGEMDYDERDHDRERFRRRAIQRILTRYPHVEADDLDYLLAKLTELGEMIPTAAAV